MKFFACLFFAAAISAKFQEPMVYDPRLEVEYHGIASSSMEHFKNIKFAHDTSGQRRFAPPEPYIPTRGSKIDATSPGPACPQTQHAVPPAFSAVEQISEDCLNLNIVRPKGVKAGDDVPVVVWAHGGGIIRGSAYDEHFDPTRLLELSQLSKQPIIFVAIQFRLGIFGFARLDTLETQKSLNIGLRDQRAALHWIKLNIASFGGDADRITALGHSAGATLFSLQTMAFGGSTQQSLPFDQAWLMSGPPGTAVNLTTDATSIHTRAVAASLQCDCTSDTSILACLRRLTMTEIFEASTNYAVEHHPPMGMFTFIPSIDGDFLPDRPSQLLRSGRFVKDVPLILGWTHDDGAVNAGPAPLIKSPQDMSGPIRQFASELSDTEMSELISLYPPEDFQEDVDNYSARKSDAAPEISAYYFALSRLLRDLLFTCSSIDFTYHMLKQSRLDTSYKSRFQNVRLYDLNQSMLNPIWNTAGMEWIGTSHGSDINYIFNGNFPEGNLRPEDKIVAEQFASNLIAFAYSGNPVSATERKEKSQSWPVAYEAFDDGEEPSRFSVQVIGGPLGTNAAHSLHQDVMNQPEQQLDAANTFEMGMLKQMVMDTMDFGSMSSESGRILDAKLRDEKLSKRCAYINGLSKSIGN